MYSNRDKKLGFSKIELLLWISILVVLAFLMIPFYNTWKNNQIDYLPNIDSNSSFHFESWNHGNLDSNSSKE